MGEAFTTAEDPLCQHGENDDNQCEVSNFLANAGGDDSFTKWTPKTIIDNAAPSKGGSTSAPAGTYTLESASKLLSNAGKSVVTAVGSVTTAVTSTGESVLTAIKDGTLDMAVSAKDAVKNSVSGASEWVNTTCSELGSEDAKLYGGIAAGSAVSLYGLKCAFGGPSKRHKRRQKQDEDQHRRKKRDEDQHRRKKRDEDQHRRKNQDEHQDTPYDFVRCLGIGCVPLVALICWWSLGLSTLTHLLWTLGVAVPCLVLILC